MTLETGKENCTDGEAGAGECKPADRAGWQTVRPRVAQLLEGVAQLGSLRRSAARMEMSYNKAWSVVHDCEEQLGFALLERRIGGAGGGGAALTEKGKELLTRYRVFEREAHELLDRLAEQHFAGLLF